MAQIASPDLPAWFCYVLVLVVGLFSARATINRLLGDYPGRWGVANTWLLFGAHVALPLTLFWFLDYTNAVRDTSLFGALVVGLGYRQVFVGGVQGIAMPGQTPALWKPFEAWVNRIASRVGEVDKRLRDRFDEYLREELSSTGKLLSGLQALALQLSKDPGRLQAEITKTDGEPCPPGLDANDFAKIQARRKAELLLRDLRVSNPENYGFYLYERNLIGRTSYQYYFRNARAKLVAVTVGAALIAVLVGVLLVFFSDRGLTLYHQWRFAKSNASDIDRWRTGEFIAAKLRAVEKTQAATLQDAEMLLAPLFRRLRFKEAPISFADDLLRVVVNCHSAALDELVVPPLIEVLRTENPDVRLRVQRALVALRRADYPPQGSEAATAEPDFIVWVPKKDESFADIDGFVRKWQGWWRSVHEKGLPATPGRR